MPSINPWAILGVLATAIGILAGGYWWGDSDRNTWWLAKTETDKRKAVEEALQTERIQQGKVNEALRQQADSQAAINNRLSADLASLRNRPERFGNLSAAAKAACTGVTGAELSRQDSEFLVGEAARADEIRAGLVACYQVIDATRP
ncbi:hypothetical protein [Flavobacterium sp.]|jgi:hypothetical protein|uniref:hypothetical protein n=1 Tax=Flavobacterium sp. TaxID=239 RepID=UPI0037BF109B